MTKVKVCKLPPITSGLVSLGGHCGVWGRGGMRRELEKLTLEVTTVWGSLPLRAPLQDFTCPLCPGAHHVQQNLRS